ncbi:natural killer cell receptor 2B4-like [Clarias gariepinus]|uniref:natural killer cell receptor 2B4-like n=1 Tax=Clarias gariepinus TaxID=13013 RepID=UPI00234D1B86|nr:natural killer cell receptor 2B4-like [Clarias gariepinus]XP_053342548.1 natural killer cell receptor 2B4-like [Clarias gariepinus]
MATTMQFVFVLFMLISTGVCDPVFKLVNSSLQLNVSKKLDDDLTWSLNQTPIVKYIKKIKDFIEYGRFEHRVEFDTETHSLTLYNVQKDDSGLYEAEYSGVVKKETAATHEINVLDPVTKPVLKTSCSLNNYTFTCEAQDLSITRSCNINECDIKEANKNDKFHSLTMNISNTSIICNHSNPVSWENTTKKIKLMTQHCTSEGSEKPTDSSNIILIAVVISIVLLAILIIGIICWRKKRETRDLVNTVYEEVDPMKKGENNAQSVEMSEKPEHPGTVYCTVGKPAEACSNDESTVRTANPGNKVMKRMRSKENCDDQNLCDTPDKIQNQGTGNAYEELESSLPQTIYATVNKGFKPM